MSPRRKGDSYYFDRILPGIGRLQAKAWTLRRPVFDRRDRLVLTLYEDGELEALRALKAGRLTIVQIEDARKRKRLHLLDTTGQGAAPLWTTVATVLARQAKVEPPLDLTRRCRHITVEGYRKSWYALQKAGVLGMAATVADLETVDWEDVERGWGRSAAHWNHLRRAISRVLTLHLGQLHPLRRDILARIPGREEIPREPDLAPEVFWAVLARVSPHLRAPIVALVAGGFRRSELQQAQRDDLMPHTCAVRVRRKVKNRWSIRNVQIEPELWSWVDAAIPVTVGMPWLLEQWHRACRAHGLPPVTFHDLRHCCGQWAMDEGADEAEVQKQLGHKTRHQTAIYTARTNRGRAAKATGSALLGGHVPTLVPTPQHPRRRHHA